MARRPSGTRPKVLCGSPTTGEAGVWGPPARAAKRARTGRALPTRRPGAGAPSVTSAASTPGQDLLTTPDPTYRGDLGGYAYTAFGKSLGPSDPGGSPDPTLRGVAPFQPFRWQGRLLIAPGLYDFRARIFSTELGAFLQPDEYGFISRGGTLWSWPGQNPLRWRDPSGRSAAEAIAEGIQFLEGLAPGVAANNNMAPASPALGLAALAAQISLQIYWGQVQALGQDMFAEQDASANAIARAAASARPAGCGDDGGSGDDDG